jgi:hypothetical protein
MLSAMATNSSAQNSADLSALMTNAGTRADPRVTDMLQQGPEGMLAYMKLWELKVQAQAYSNVFLFLAVCTFVGVLFALTFSSEKPDATGPKHLDLGM